MSTEKNELAELLSKHLSEPIKAKLKTLMSAFKSEETKEFEDIKTKAEAFIATNKNQAKTDLVKVALAAAEKDKEKIKDLTVLLEDAPAGGETYNEVPLADGSILKYTGDLAAGSKCVLVTAEGEVPAPEGEHKLADGSTIVVKKEGEESVISEIKPAEEMKDQAILAAIQKALEPITKEFEAFKSENKKLKTEFEATKLKLSERSSQLKELSTVVAEMAAIVTEPIQKNNINKPLSTVYKARF